MPVTIERSTADNEPPLVSVVITTYNGQRFIRQALESMLGQTYPRLEVVVVDDGSTDDTPRILESVTDPRLRILRQANRGHSGALNSGIAAAAGEFVAFLGHDDVSHPERVSKQVAYLTVHPECGLVGTQYVAIDEHGVVLGPYIKPLTHEAIVKVLRTSGNSIASPSIMVRRDVLTAVGGFRSEFDLAEDNDLCQRVSETWEVANLPDVLLQWRYHMGSVTQTRYYRQKAVSSASRECGRRRRLGLPEDVESSLRVALQEVPPPRRRASEKRRRAAVKLTWGICFFTLGKRKQAISPIVGSLALAPAQPRAWAFLLLSVLPKRMGTPGRAWAKHLVRR